jgi:hypothetical protein
MEKLKKDRSLTDTRCTGSHDVGARHDASVVRDKLVKRRAGSHWPEQFVAEVEISQLSQHTLIELDGFRWRYTGCLLGLQEVTLILWQPFKFSSLSASDSNIALRESAFESWTSVESDGFAIFDFVVERCFHGENGFND